MPVNIVTCGILVLNLNKENTANSSYFFSGS